VGDLREVPQRTILPEMVETFNPIRSKARDVKEEERRKKGSLSS